MFPAMKGGVSALRIYDENALAFDDLCQTKQMVTDGLAAVALFVLCRGQ